MRASPTGLCIKALFVSLNAFPAEKVQSIVRAHGFDHMIGFAIAPFTAMHFVN
jgi:hypothetical protein